MKILLVNTRHYSGGGDSTYTFNLADLLKNKGHEVAFFGMQDKLNLPDPNSDLFVSHIDFRELNQRKNPISGLKVLTRSIYSTEARIKFSRMLDRFQPDIIHLQNIHAHITPSVIFEAKKRGIPIVWALHDYKLLCPNSHFLIDTNNLICEACHGGNFIQAVHLRCKKGSLLASSIASLEAYVHRWMNVLSKVDVFLCPSSFLRGKLIENGFSPEKVHHIPLFLPEAQFVQQDQNQGYLLFLGKLEPLKGIFPLIEAARRVPEVRVIMAGRVEEPLKSQLPGLLPSNMEYVGQKSGAELDTLRRNAIALVIPSIWYENQPFSILEMFACGKPVIASDLGGMTELVTHLERGLLIPPNDATELAKAMVWLFTHPIEARKFGQDAYSYAQMHHSSDKHYESLIKIYRTVQPTNNIPK
jgi:glycosyltransferase involved in cell wall biosynthesis